MIGQFLVNCLITGAIYSLASSGFSLIYHVHRVLHFAHGAAILVAAYLLYYLVTALHLPLALAAALAVAAATATGLLLDVTIYRAFRRRGTGALTVLIVSLAVLMMTEAVVALVAGPEVKSVYPAVVFDRLWQGAAAITGLQACLILASWVSLAGIVALLRWTRLGHQMIALSDSPRLAAIVGLPTEAIHAAAIVCASLLAGTLGSFIALEQNIYPAMGSQLVLKGFASTVVGGIGSVPGAVAGAYFLASLEHLAVWFVPAGYRDAVAFGVLLLFLLVRREGLIAVVIREDE